MMGCGGRLVELIGAAVPGHRIKWFVRAADELEQGVENALFGRGCQAP